VRNENSSAGQYDEDGDDPIMHESKRVERDGEMFQYQGHSERVHLP
jgi:hypothetical protein